MTAGPVLRLLPLALVPISLALGRLDAAPALVFLVAAAAIVPLADWIRKGTEHVAATAGAAIGGLLNVTLGNAAELILALFVLAAGKPSVVKATITGSIVGNSLLGLGLAIVVGSWGRERQSFHRERAGLLGTLLIISVIALLVPALFDYTERNLRSVPSVGTLDERLSLGVAVVLILTYGANLIYTLVTHRDIFSVEQETAEAGASRWPLWQALAVLVAATAAVAF